MEKISKKRKKLLDLTLLEIENEINIFYVFYFDSSCIRTKMTKYTFINTHFDFKCVKFPVSMQILRNRGAISNKLPKRRLVLFNNLIYKNIDYFYAEDEFFLLTFNYSEFFNNVTNVYFLTSCE